MIAVVDTEDFERLNRYNWSAEWQPTTRSFYATRHSPRGKLQMAREVLRLPKGNRQQVDHRSHDTLDNRKCNLRKATHQQNRHNQRPLSSSGFKGVILQDGRWRARIHTADHKHRSLGCFDTPEQAAKAYDEAARKLHGEFAFLNFPPGE